MVKAALGVVVLLVAARSGLFRGRVGRWARQLRDTHTHSPAGCSFDPGRGVIGLGFKHRATCFFRSLYCRRKSTSLERA